MLFYWWRVLLYVCEKAVRTPFFRVIVNALNCQNRSVIEIAQDCHIMHTKEVGNITFLTWPLNTTMGMGETVTVEIPFSCVVVNALKS